MMFFQDAQYPNYGTLIRGKLRALKSDQPRVFEALATVLESTELAQSAIAAGTYPRVKVARLMKNGKWQRNVGGQFSGECDADAVNYVYVNKSVATGYEDDHSSSTTIERVTLHEVAHWGRFQNGLPAKINGKEAGSWFEYLAYGLDYIGHPPVECP